jgi:hypothetical protein
MLTVGFFRLWFSHRPRESTVTQQHIDQQMQRLMQAEAAGKITPAELEAHLDALRREIRA